MRVKHAISLWLELIMDICSFYAHPVPKEITCMHFFIDRVALAKRGDNGIGSIRPSVHPSVCVSEFAIRAVLYGSLGRPPQYQPSLWVFSFDSSQGMYLVLGMMIKDLTK